LPLASSLGNGIFIDTPVPGLWAEGCFGVTTDSPLWNEFLGVICAGVEREERERRVEGDSLVLLPWKERCPALDDRSLGGEGVWGTLEKASPPAREFEISF